MSQMGTVSYCIPSDRITSPLRAQSDRVSASKATFWGVYNINQGVSCLHETRRPSRHKDVSFVPMGLTGASGCGKMKGRCCSRALLCGFFDVCCTE